MKKQSVSALALMATLAACTTSTDPVYTQFYREAGAHADNGSFGEATNNNTLVMNGERQYTVDLANRFATEITSTVTFGFNSAQLDGTAQAVLRQQADWIRQFPEIRFRVFGHTDAVGSTAYNRRLGLARANAVVSYLTSMGISRSRLEAVVSFGETQPLIVTQGRERRNRRTVTEVSGFVARHPQVLDGKYAEIIYRDYIASAVPPSQLEGITGSDLRTEQ
ncbi:MULTISPECIES: OmpA family protein [Roseobacteraceae]|uniref:Outer membrane protein P6 n=1 Tax=Pseudosulfitobacter pseudonitzschiae TaxID=1402135 RepID=A0A221K262_9RHOB|nr:MULTISPECIES: OmpA family protein [Roseobacteraceae]ASM72980.1 outer membrane protein P6 [Pseudosulfitobacter pseudonitzschiae]